MADEGYITEDEAKAAAISSSDNIETKTQGSEGYIADWVDSLIPDYIGDVKQDIVVQTTIDWDLQKQAEYDLKQIVAKDGAKNHFTQGALVTLGTDGTVKAVLGGVDYEKSQYNRAVTARRQTGSAFKPFVYLTALEHGYTPDTVVYDTPLNYNGWQPENDEKKYFGAIHLRDALAYSLNTVAARLAIDVGPQEVVNTAMRMGISSPLQAVPSMALGTNSMSLLELTQGYVPFSNGGFGAIAHVIAKITTTDGKVLYQDTDAGPGQVVTPEHVAMMNDMLSEALEVGTGKRAKLDGWQIAGKTGTSQDDRDAVFVGYTSKLVTGVWLGNDDNSPTRLYGGTVPTKLWSEVMQAAHKGLSPTPLPGYEAALDNSNPDLQPMEQPETGAPPADMQPQVPATRNRQNLMDLLNGLFGGG
jgi:penicillin-binding protein 1A